MCLVGREDFPPVYIRSEHNFAADNLTRWSDEAAEQWEHQEGMSGANAAGALRKSMDLPYNSSPLIDNRPNTFTMLSPVLRFFSSYNHRVCEWRSSIYSVKSALENWGLPVF